MSKPIRVLQVFASLDRGGAESMIMSLYRSMDRDKVQFDFVVNENEGEYSYESEIRELGGRLFYVPIYKISNFSSYKKAWESLLKEHPEWYIIHGHHTSTAFICLSIAKRLNRVTIAHSHTAGGELKIKSLLKIIMRYPLRYISNHLFSCSLLAAKWMFGKHYSSTHIINNTIDTQKFVFNEHIRIDERNKMKVENKFVIGHVGRFDTAKNQSFLVDIFKEINKKNLSTVLILVGDGRLRHSIEQKVKDLGLGDSIIFTGVRSDIPQLLQVFDIFVFPSIYEGLPVTLVEAQASGLPCIISDTITEEVKITNQVEFISLDQSPEYWAEQVLKYANGYERKSTYEEICKSGYDIKEKVKWLEDFYIEEYNKIRGLNI